jgi:hypothetical protein
MDGETNPSTYPPPVDKLLTYGDIADFHEWPNYLELGLTEDHVPDLIRMALDKHLNWADEQHPELWNPPIHAVRALGQLRAVAAVEPLSQLFHEFEEIDGSDWVSSDLPRAYGLIGATAIPGVAAYLLDDTHGVWPRITAVDALETIAQAHPETRDQIVQVMMEQLEHYEASDPALNAAVIGVLADYKVVEATPLIEKAFDARAVDIMIGGDWHDVQVQMGLKPDDAPRDWERQMAAYMESLGIVSPLTRMMDDDDDEDAFLDEDEDEDELLPPAPKAQPRGGKQAKAKKAKRKQAEKSRKVNRKRK